MAPPASSMASRPRTCPGSGAILAIGRAGLERPFLLSLLLDWEHGQCGARRASGCGAGVEYVAVDPAGRIFPCHQFVGEERWQLGDVFSGITATAIRDSFLRVGISDKPECRDCWARYHCGGGCHANAWWANSRFDKPYNQGCELLKIRTEAAL